MPNTSGRTKFAGLNQVWILSHIVELQPRHWGFEGNESSNERFCGEVVTRQIWFRLYDSCPTIQAARNLLSWIKCESIFTSSSQNPSIKGSSPTEGHYSILLIRIFFFSNPPLSPLLYSFAKLILYFKLLSYTLSTMQSKAESKNSSHPNYYKVCFSHFQTISTWVIKSEVGEILDGIPMVSLLFSGNWSLWKCPSRLKSLFR